MSDAQLIFLANLDNRFVAKAATNTSHFVQNRLPIVLWKETPPETGSLSDGKPRGKIIENTMEEEILDGDSVDYAEQATLRFNISYPPIP